MEMLSPPICGVQACDGLTLTHNEKENVFDPPDPAPDRYLLSRSFLHWG